MGSRFALRLGHKGKISQLTALEERLRKRAPTETRWWITDAKS